jgi:hypothetical protein
LSASEKVRNVCFQDSICSWISEPESVVNNWRGWRKNPAANTVSFSGFPNQNSATGSLASALASALFTKRQQSEGQFFFFLII